MAQDRGDTTLLLDVQRLGVEYAAENGTVKAVNDVSFTLRRGEILGLAGESGSGKSTLAYAVARLLRPPAAITQGQALYYPRVDLDVARYTQKHKRQQVQEILPEAGMALDVLHASDRQLQYLRWNEIAVVFQSAMNALNPVMTIGDQILDVLHTHRPGMDKQARQARVDELLRLVGISTDRQHSYSHELSGGMRQRAIIAIALALNPELIILDEPTTALDVVVQREILTELLRLRKQLNFAVIFITHDLSLLLEVADSIAIMYAGRIVETGSRRDIYRHPRHPYSYGLLNAFPSLVGPKRKMYSIPGSPPDLRNIPSGCAFRTRCPLAFSTCAQHLPVLLPYQEEEQATVTATVACHLYNPAYREQAPALKEIEQAYASAEKQRRRS
ncbi:dipeptide/oligopeptide/nickel ABC transporter ATP-binding protein [Dictyobacter alpinus]|uniref:Dipeptide/oligopeptide/nickel ABC transporter ATP-binding protein n=1 Tax=Dictyobacter alpinus TaxID=2014873 RepID=A0A402BAZ3_9CHLR|nr:ABC transporter ATP-binding protein [Dictyobacter alpinus]GCE28499.1 dipeptide/oligopeptide/nickel ABC transporter ATP-binding protein [Dictyobacter alpinus]